jgi:hypothetical protein
MVTIRVVPTGLAWECWRFDGPGGARNLWFDLHANGQGEYRITQALQLEGTFTFSTWDDGVAVGQVTSILRALYPGAEITFATTLATGPRSEPVAGPLTIPAGKAPWNDPAVFLAWLNDLEHLLEEVLEVAGDQLAPEQERIHGVAGARAALREADASLRHQLEHARARLGVALAQGVPGGGP